MHSQDLCTEEQAAKLAGVSARTLHRFCESGYLTVTKEADGSRRYLLQQVCEIFGMHGAPESIDTTSENTPEGLKESLTATTESAGTSQQVSLLGEGLSAEVPNVEARAQQDGAHTHSEKQIGLLELEIQRLKHLLSIQERILDAKDDEIADLRNQRTWLRERVEKFEEKSDRDQILLLSETQTIRSLLAYQESRKSTFRQLLEWVGLAQNSQLPALTQSTDQKSKSSTSSRTIEVKRAANSG
jgi:hypothetical protein